MAGGGGGGGGGHPSEIEYRPLKTGRFTPRHSNDPLETRGNTVKGRHAKQTPSDGVQTFLSLLSLPFPSFSNLRDIYIYIFTAKLRDCNLRPRAEDKLATRPLCAALRTYLSCM